MFIPYDKGVRYNQYTGQPLTHASKPPDVRPQRAHDRYAELRNAQIAKASGPWSDPRVVISRTADGGLQMRDRIGKDATKIIRDVSGAVWQTLPDGRQIRIA